jgi:MFS transporter, ACS family, tartrate transporter
MAFVTGETGFYIIRFLLGAAEAGFFPGIIFYLTLWFPAAYRGRIIGMFMAAIPLSAVIGAPLSSMLLYLDGGLGLRGWQWIFIIEAVPAIILSVVVYFFLTEEPSEAKWLAADERTWLVARQENERAHREAIESHSVFQALTNLKVLALGVVGISIAYSIYGLAYFLPQVVKAFGVTNMQTGLITAIPFAIGTVGMIWYGRRSDRLLERRSHTVVALLLTGLGIAAAAVIDDPYIKMAWLCIAGFGAFAVLPSFWAIPTAFLSGAAAAAGIAFINSIANIAGFVGPMIIGYIKDATGSFSGGFLVIAGVSLVAGIVLLCTGHEKALEEGLEPNRKAPSLAE